MTDFNVTTTHSTNITGEILTNSSQNAASKAKELFLTQCKTNSLPFASAIVKSMDPLNVALHIMLVIMTAFTLGFFIEEIYYLRNRLNSSYRKRLTFVQLGIPPIFTVSSLMGSFFPSGHVMIDFVTSVYFGVALHCLLVLMINYYGGLKKFLRCFQSRTVSIKTGPLCCCLICLPEITMTRKRFRYLWYATYQSAFLRPITLFIQGVLGSDDSVKVPGVLYTAILVASMMTGMWALVILRKASSELIGQFRITGKFFVFQLVILIANLQPAVLKATYFTCVLPFTFKARQLILNYQITIVEFFILSLLTRFFYRKASDNEEFIIPVASTEMQEKSQDLEKEEFTNAEDDARMIV